MINAHIDIQSIIQEEIQKRRETMLGHVQQVNHSKKVRENPNFKVVAEGETVPSMDELGPQQVESLLTFVVEDSVERALTTTELDNIVYDGLGDHRILGRAKKKKKKTTLYA